MDDSELQRIRAARLAELQSQSSGQPGSTPSSSGAGGSGSGGGGSSEDDTRHAQLSQILTPSARDRLRRIALVKPERARGIEDLILRMARQGQIRQRVGEDELVSLLNDVAQQQADAEKPSIRNLRRQDSDDEGD